MLFMAQFKLDKNCICVMVKESDFPSLFWGKMFFLLFEASANMRYFHSCTGQLQCICLLIIAFQFNPASVSFALVKNVFFFKKNTFKSQNIICYTGIYHSNWIVSICHRHQFRLFYYI